MVASVHHEGAPLLLRVRVGADTPGRRAEFGRLRSSSNRSTASAPTARSPRRRRGSSAPGGRPSANTRPMRPSWRSND